eukprot:gene15789-biopygen4994
MGHAPALRPCPPRIVPLGCERAAGKASVREMESDRWSVSRSVVQLLPGSAVGSLGVVIIATPGGVVRVGPRCGEWVSDMADNRAAVPHVVKKPVASVEER